MKLFIFSTLLISLHCLSQPGQAAGGRSSNSENEYVSTPGGGRRMIKKQEKILEIAKKSFNAELEPCIKSDNITFKSQIRVGRPYSVCRFLGQFHDNYLFDTSINSLEGLSSCKKEHVIKFANKFRKKNFGFGKDNSLKALTILLEEDNKKIRARSEKISDKNEKEQALLQQCSINEFSEILDKYKNLEVDAVNSEVVDKGSLWEKFKSLLPSGTKKKQPSGKSN